MQAPSELQAFLESQLEPALDLLRRMVEINSWTWNRDGVRQVGEVTAQAFADLGFTPEWVPSTQPKFGDHLALSRPGRFASTIAMVSHLDTVFSPEEEQRNNFHWSSEGPRIFGPGTHDIKGGTVVMWLTLAALKHLHPHLLDAVGWKLFWNSSEEVLSTDFGGVCRQRLDNQTRAVLVFEAEGKGPGVRRLVVSRKGRGVWKLEVAGRAAHAGVRPGAGANAIVQLGRLVDRIHRLNDETRQLSVNVGLIRGGSGLNRVPHDAMAEGEFRAFAPEVYAQAREALLALSGPGDVASVIDGFRCQASMTITEETSPWPRNAGTDRLFELWKQTASDIGMGVEPESRGGLSDGNHLWGYFPTLDGLGPAGDNDHCSERSADGTKLPEFVERDSFVPKAALNMCALVRLLESSGIR